jgi:hypothetical protein
MFGSVAGERAEEGGGEDGGEDGGDAPTFGPLDIATAVRFWNRCCVFGINLVELFIVPVALPFARYFIISLVECS